MPLRMQPRAIVDREGVEHASDDVLLAILLRTGIRGCNVVELARYLHREYGSLTGLARASIEELSRVNGVGRVKAQTLKVALELARRLNEEKLGDQPVIKTPDDVAALLMPRSRSLEREVFWTLHLDTRNRVKNTGKFEISEGTLNASLVDPKDVFRAAVSARSASIIVAHNHPSGDPSPSSEDIRVTRKLLEAGRMMEIPVLDHIIIGTATQEHGGYISLRESGMLEFE